MDVGASGDASTGKCILDTLVARPGLEKAPVGTKQVLYLDFNGARVNFNKFALHFVNGAVKLPAMSASLPDWGLTAADENAVIEGVIAKVKQKLSTYVRANGLNGDYSQTHVPGQFDIDIRNSRDDPDDFGHNPYESRIVIGGTNAQVGFPADISGLAEGVDLGNFKTDDQAVLVLDYIKGGMGFIGIQPPATTIDFVTEGIATAAAHEAGHLFGAFHTDQADTGDVFAGVPNLMDPHSIIETVGPDLTFGTADDVNVQLGTDAYQQNAGFGGRDDTLNTVAFDLSTGKGHTDDRDGNPSGVSPAALKAIPGTGGATGAKTVAFSADLTGTSRSPVLTEGGLP
jgi:hypothetical protein